MCTKEVCILILTLISMILGMLQNTTSLINEILTNNAPKCILITDILQGRQESLNEHLFNLFY